MGGALAIRTRQDVGAAWDAAVQVAASAYGIEAAQLMAPSRGRGPRPPQNVWTAKKMAVHLAVMIADCDYAVLGRLIGLHRDTVASHCAGIRAAMAEDEDFEALGVGLEQAAKIRAASAVLTPRELDLSRPLDNLLTAMRAYQGAVNAPLIRQFIRQNDPSSDNPAAHGNLIKKAGTARARS